MKVEINIEYENWEDFIITAMEQSIHYWAALSKATGMDETNEPISVRVASALYWNPEASVTFVDVEDESEEYEAMTYHTIRDRFNDFPLRYMEHLVAVLDGSLDAVNADVVFQVLLFGDVNYG